jgi:hypothetical protein
VGSQTYDGTTPRGVWIYDTSTQSYGPADIIDNCAAMIQQKGDVNGDRDIDIADAVCIVNYVVGKPNTTFIAAAADANGDGDIDIADAVHIVNYVVGKISALAPRFERILPEPE